MESDHALLVQRFKFLNAVHAIAAADVAQCIEAVGLDALKGVAASNALSNITKHHQTRHSVRPRFDQSEVAEKPVQKPRNVGRAPTQSTSHVKPTNVEADAGVSPAEQAAVRRLAMMLEAAKANRSGRAERQDVTHANTVDSAVNTAGPSKMENRATSPDVPPQRVVSVEVQPRLVDRPVQVDSIVAAAPAYATETRATSPQVRRAVSFGVEVQPEHVDQPVQVDLNVAAAPPPCATENRATSPDVPPLRRAVSVEAHLERVNQPDTRTKVGGQPVCVDGADRETVRHSEASIPSVDDLLFSIDELLGAESKIATRHLTVVEAIPAMHNEPQPSSPPVASAAPLRPRKHKRQRGQIPEAMRNSILNSRRALCDANSFNEGLWNVSGVPMSQFGRRFAEDLLRDLVDEVQAEICAAVDEAVDDVVEYEVGADI